MSYPDVVVAPIAEVLLACFEETIAEVLDPPASVGMRVGQQVDALLSVNEDECCSGLGWVRVDRVYPSSNETFPLQDQTAEIGCEPRSWAIALELGVMRCAPTPNQYNIPSNEEWMDLFTRQMQDAAAMRRAVICCLGGSDITYLLGEWAPLPVSGRCSGGTMQVTVAAEYIDCCAKAPESPGDSPSA